MEKDQRGFSGRDGDENQNRTDGSNERFQNESQGYNQNDPNQRNASKFEQDSDDFLTSGDDMDAMNASNAGFTGSGTSSTYSGSGSDEFGFSTDDMDENENRNLSGLNDNERSQRTNSDEDSSGNDWTPRNL